MGSLAHAASRPACNRRIIRRKSGLLAFTELGLAAGNWEYELESSGVWGNLDPWTQRRGILERFVVQSLDQRYEYDIVRGVGSNSRVAPPADISRATHSYISFPIQPANPPSCGRRWDAVPIVSKRAGISSRRRAGIVFLTGELSGYRT